MVVVTLIVAMLMILVPVLKGFSQGRLERAANTQLVSDLNSARHKAINSASPVYIVFCPSLSSFARGLSAANSQALAKHMGASKAANNLLSGQQISYAFYAEGAVGDQPTHSRSPRRIDNKKYVSEWKKLPEGTMFTTNLLNDLRQMNTLIELQTGASQSFTMDASGNRWPAPKPCGLDNEYPGNIGIQLPYIGFGPNGQVLGVYSGHMYKTPVNTMSGADGYFSLKIATGSVFPPEVEGGSGFYKATVADAQEAQVGYSKYNIIRINMLTGRSKSNVCDVYWDKEMSQVAPQTMYDSVRTVLSEMIADHDLKQTNFLNFNQRRPLLLKEVGMKHARLFESLLLGDLLTVIKIDEKKLRAELLFD